MSITIYGDSYIRCTACGEQQHVPGPTSIAGTVSLSKCPHCGSGKVNMALGVSAPPSWWRETKVVR